MTPEEAKRHLRNVIRWEGSVPDADALRTAIDALERQEKYRWHDLRKNPDDLPQKDGYYLGAFKFRNAESLGVDVAIECSVVTFCEGKFYGYNRMWDIKGWKEIEPFEEEDV